MIAQRSARASRRSDVAVRKAVAVAVVIPAGIFVIATGLSLPEWLAVGLLGLAPLITAAWLVTFLRREHERAAPAPRVWPVEKPAPVITRRAIGYVVLEPGDGQLARRTDELRVWCAAKGLTLGTVVHDSAGAGDQRSRPSLQWALAQIDAGAADTLVVTRLVDLSPNVASLSPLLRWFIAGGRELVAIDLRLETSTPEGRLAAEAVAGIGSWERERISARTRRGLEAARSRGGGHGRQAVADVPELQAAHHAYARAGDDPAGDRRRAQPRGRSDAARRCDVAAFQRAARGGLPAPGHGLRGHRASAPRRLNADIPLRIYARGRMWNRGAP